MKIEAACEFCGKNKIWIEQFSICEDCLKAAGISVEEIKTMEKIEEVENLCTINENWKKM